MKKWIALLLALLLLCMCGCHGKGVVEGTVSSEAAEDSTEKLFDIGELDPKKTYEIRFWAKNDTNKTQTDIYEKAVKDFESLYPNIKVSILLYTDYGRIFNDVKTNIATNTTPNVCITYPDHIATYLTGKDIVVPLDHYLSDAAYGLGGSELLFDSPAVSEIVPQFLNECYIGGTCYALPYMRSTEACYVNKTYVEELGYKLPEMLTWDFIWEVSEAAMEKNKDGTFKINGQKVMIPFIYKSTDNMMITMLRQKNAAYSGGNGTIGIFNDTTRELLATIGEHAKTRAFSTFKISSYPANFLNAGQCIFAIDSTAGATWMGTDAPLLDISKDQLVEFETVVMTIPQYDTENPKMISQGPSICIFNKEDKGEVLASWLFTQYLLTNEVQVAYSETEGYVPVTTKAQMSEAYQDYLAKAGEDRVTHYYVKIEAAKLLLDNTANTFTTAVFDGSASLRDAAGQLIENVCKAQRRNETMDKAYMEKLFDSVISMYHLNQGGLRISSKEIENPWDPASYSAGAADTSKKDLGPLPATAVALLASLAAVWVLLASYVLYRRWKQHRQTEK